MSQDRPPRGPAAKSTLQGITPGEDAYVTTQPGGTATPTQDTIVPVGYLLDETAVVLPEAGYQMGDVIGRGGMGEIVAAMDQRIGREVAIKRMRGASAEPVAIARFLREARIQARLDHPAIVPVHELGTDAQGRPYFTMKRLTGVTLHERLSQGGPIQPLLRAFIDVCMAVELAHTRGVVHRDLKPANIMLGDYNEVYVLDWGVARVLADRPQTANRGDIHTLEDGTMTGGLLGTPGYMSPEQIDGEQVVTATDVYALGAILFEILAGEPLHPRGRAAIATTIDEPQDAPAKRRPERAIAPELDAACFDALARDPAARPTARGLADRVQRYLDGDRDMERRRELATAQLRSAHEALASESPDARATAMRRAGRALALDPDSTDAAALVTKLMVEPPTTFPRSLQASLDEEDRHDSSARSRKGMLSYASAFAFLLALPWMHVASWSWLIAINVVLAGLIGFTYYCSRIGRVPIWFAMAGNITLALVWSRLASPFMLTPVLVCGVATAMSSNPQFRPRRAVFIAFVAIATTLPVVLEWFGVLDETWRMDGGTFMIRSAIFASPGVVDAAMLVSANTIFVAIVGLYAYSVNLGAREAKQKIHIQAWHLQQLLPTTAEPASAGAPRPWATRRVVAP